MPKRINRCVELLEDGQPIYYTGTKDLTYQNGKAMAKTWADYITVDMEHGALDMPGLSQFMRGLVDGGPTSSGHRTPAVIMSMPTDGTDEQVVRANAWMVKQGLARGVHGILLCHAETPGAARAFGSKTASVRSGTRPEKPSLRSKPTMTSSQTRLSTRTSPRCWGASLSSSTTGLQGSAPESSRALGAARRRCRTA